MRQTSSPGPERPLREALATAVLWLPYQLALALALVAAAPYFLLRRGSHYAETIAPRLGFGSGRRPAREPGERLWIHAVSVGEVGVAATLARALPAGERLVVTTVTPTGQQRARATFTREPFAGRAAVTYLPFDLGFAVRRFLGRFSPRALVLTEGDLWPVLLRAVRRRGLPVVVVNGRVSDRSFRRMRRLRPLLGPLLGPVGRFGVQSAADARRLRELGVPEDRVAVTGNLKYEAPAPPGCGDLEAALGALAAGRPVLVAGSTMAGEDEAVLAAFRAAGGGDRALLVVAPRHPERWDQVAQLLESQGWRFVRRSAPGPAAAEAIPEVVLLDSLGELAGLYRLAAGAFIGGTLVPTGGHNPLEAARFAVPVAAGPSMTNFREIAEDFDRADAWVRLESAAALGAVWSSWLEAPEAAAALGRRGAALLEANRGALERTLELLGPALAGGGSQGGAP